MAKQAAMVIMMDNNNGVIYPLSVTQNIYHKSQPINNMIEEIVQMEYMDQETFDNTTILENHTYNIYEPEQQ